jgi:outer membrane protein assembly factor BamB
MFWMTAAGDGRFVVLSSKAQDQGKLFVWDTQTHEFRHRLDPPAGATRPGPIVEGLKGLIIGHTVGADERPILYGFDPAVGQILWTKPVPSPPITAFSQVRRQAYSFRRGPKGFIWAFFGDTLVKIDPRNARVEPVGKTSPAQLAFAGGEVYIAGGPGLRRVELP